MKKLCLLFYFIFILFSEIGHAQTANILGGSVLLQNVDSSECGRRLSKGILLDQGEQALAYDTLREYVESCYPYSDSWQAFGELDNAIAGVPGPNSKWLDFRNWLFKVLYYNRDTNYYCSDFATMLSTFVYSGGGRGFDANGKLAVEKYILEANKCPGLTKFLTGNMITMRNGDISHWRDTVKDSLKTPYDSTLPTLEQIGFSRLRGPEFGKVDYAGLPKEVLGAVRALRSPFVNNAEVEYTLEVPATLTVELFDALGGRRLKVIPSVFTGEGEHSIRIAGEGLTAGIYYLRFSVPEGEVRTLRLVKE